MDHLTTLELIQVNHPKNFDKKLLARQEPSYEFIPIFNRTTLHEMWKKNETQQNETYKENEGKEVDLDPMEIDLPF